MPADDTQVVDQTAKPDAESSAPDTSKTDAPADKAAAPEKAPEGEKQGEAAPKTALEAAKRVMAKEGKTPSEGKAADGEQSSPEKSEGAKDASTRDDEPEPSVKNSPAYRKLSSEHRILAKAKEMNEAAIKELEPKAKTYDQLATYITESNLSKDDFQEGLAVMRALRNDPVEAYKRLKPIMDQLETTLGERLPDDLKAKVESGHIDEATARELARARGGERVAREKAEALQQRQQREIQERQQRDEQSEVDRQVEEVVGALNAAEVEWTKSDPDAPKLKRLLNQAVMVNGQLNPPKNAAEAKALFENSLKEVRKELGLFAPRPQAKDGMLPHGAPPNQATPVPKSSLEAAQAALAGRR